MCARLVLLSIVVIIIVVVVAFVHRLLILLLLDSRTLGRLVLLGALDGAGVPLEAVVASSDLLGADGVGNVVVAVEGGKVGRGLALVGQGVELSSSSSKGGGGDGGGSSTSNGGGGNGGGGELDILHCAHGPSFFRFGVPGCRVKKLW